MHHTVAEVLQNLSVKRSNATSCNSSRTPREHGRCPDQSVHCERQQPGRHPGLPCDRTSSTAC